MLAHSLEDMMRGQLTLRIVKDKDGWSKTVLLKSQLRFVEDDGYALYYRQSGEPIQPETGLFLLERLRDYGVRAKLQLSFLGVLMKECPKCGTIDAPYWLPRPFDRETDLIKTEDLAWISPKLEARIPEARVTRSRIGSASEKMDLVEGVYVYRRTMESPYVLRLWLPLYQQRHGFSVPPGYWDGLSRRRWMRKLCSQFGRRMYLKGVSLGA